MTDDSIHTCPTCHVALVRLDVPKCVDQQRFAHQCPKCKTNDRSKFLGPYVYDMLSWCPCAVCSRLGKSALIGTLDRSVLEREIIGLVLGDMPPPEGQP